MQRWRSRPLSLPIETARVSRLDIELEELRRDEGSFSAFVFLDDHVPPDAGRDYPTFAAAFSVFAHTRCWGGEGHCDWKRGPVSAFDQRPEHHLTPINITIDVTDAAKRLPTPTVDQLVVTIHAARLEEPELAEGVIRFASLTAVAYQ